LDPFALLPKERRLDHEQLSSVLVALRADRLFAVTLAGDAEAIEAVLGEAKREAAKPRVAAKALGDPLADLTYTPLTPCRIADSRIGGGAFAPRSRRARACASPATRSSTRSTRSTAVARTR
jgi:hypothetical protein